LRGVPKYSAFGEQEDNIYLNKTHDLLLPFSFILSSTYPSIPSQQEFHRSYSSPHRENSARTVTLIDPAAFEGDVPPTVSSPLKPSPPSSMGSSSSGCWLATWKGQGGAQNIVAMVP
jgi:hypothetical protein